VETWESLKQRLYHLSELGDALADFVVDPDYPTWLYQEICNECNTVCHVALDLWRETTNTKYDIRDESDSSDSPTDGEDGWSDHH
jgi:hypothetical protein